MVFFDRLDVTEEIRYLKGGADLAARKPRGELQD
jgi:hypothetical protein